jgi:hypothetical protein
VIEGSGVRSLGHKQRQVHAGLGEMGQGGVMELVKGPSGGGDLERAADIARRFIVCP